MPTSRTRPERRFGGCHARENMADQLTASYAELGIPPAPVRIFNGDLPGGGGRKQQDSIPRPSLHTPAYAADRAFFLKD
jgi:hypothetical protein